MAGHSKWANIKYRKERADAKKGKLFSRAAKEIISAVKTGGPDPKSNTRLRLAIQNAKAVNLPSDSIDRNIKKGSSEAQADFTEVVYELYGHGGVGIIAVGLTDNKNRTASEIRIATNKRGGTVATPGAVSYMFERKGVIQVAKEGLGEDDLFLAVTEAGAEDFDNEEDAYVVITDPDSITGVREAVEALGGQIAEVELQLLPTTSVECDAETAKSNQALIEWLENIDDLDSVYHNMASN